MKVQIIDFIDSNRFIELKVEQAYKTHTFRRAVFFA